MRGCQEKISYEKKFIREKGARGEVKSVKSRGNPWCPEGLNPFKKRKEAKNGNKKRKGRNWKGRKRNQVCEGP